MIPAAIGFAEISGGVEENIRPRYGAGEAVPDGKVALDNFHAGQPAKLGLRLCRRSRQRAHVHVAVNQSAD
jgi:hypothetical protein